MMQVWAVEYNPTLFTDSLYESGLAIVDNDSRIRCNKFFRRQDACRALISSLLPRLLCGFHIQLRKTDAGKPFIPQSSIAYNISHDNDFVVMAFAPNTPVPPPIKGVNQTAAEAGSIGIDVMKAALPGRHDTYWSFVPIFQEQVCFAITSPSLLTSPI
jgi:4'-phosphopantetheinyl transferase